MSSSRKTMLKTRTKKKQYVGFGGQPEFGGGRMKNQSDSKISGLGI